MNDFWSTFLLGMLYSIGVQIIGYSLNLQFITGLGIWITGFALMQLIVSEIR